MAGRLRRRHSPDAGITLLETMIVTALAAATLAITAPAFRLAAATVQGDANMRIMAWQLKTARETAINQRRPIEVQFTNGNTIKLVRRDLPSGTTLLQTAALEHHTTFLLFAGQPDTPDGFGRTTATWFGGASPVMFTADGMLTDASGNPVNGSIFLGQADRPYSSRALTITGATATIRTYRWNGSAWKR